MTQKWVKNDQNISKKKAKKKKQTNKQTHTHTRKIAILRCGRKCRRQFTLVAIILAVPSYEAVRTVAPSAENTIIIAIVIIILEIIMIIILIIIVISSSNNIINNNKNDNNSNNNNHHHSNNNKNMVQNWLTLGALMSANSRPYFCGLGGAFVGSTR